MARFKLINLEIKTVTKEGDNKGNVYLLADLINLSCPWDDPQKFSSFNKPMCELLKQYITIGKGGTAVTEQPIPDQYGIISGSFVEFTPPQKFYKTYLTDQPGRGIKAGDLVSKDGIPVVYETLIVFVQSYIDDDKTKAYLKGGSPVEVGMRAFNSYCVHISTDSTPVGIPAGGSQGDSSSNPIKVSAADAKPEQSNPPNMPAAPDGFHYVEMNGSVVLQPI